MTNGTTHDPMLRVRSLLKNDPFSCWMGIEILNAGPGHCKISCKISEDMLNGFNIAHGGILFSIADTALAFAAATTGNTALSIDNSISFTRKAVLGDVLTASCESINETRKTGLYLVTIHNQEKKTVACMKGTVYKPEATGDS